MHGYWSCPQIYYCDGGGYFVSHLIECFGLYNHGISVLLCDKPRSTKIKDILCKQLPKRLHVREMNQAIGKGSLWRLAVAVSRSPASQPPNLTFSIVLKTYYPSAELRSVYYNHTCCNVKWSYPAWREGTYSRRECRKGC